MFESIIDKYPNLLGVLIGSFFLGLSGAVMPGPVLVRTLSRIPEHGALTGPLVVFGHMIIELALVVLLALGLEHFIKEPFLWKMISFVGGTVMIGFAVSMFREIPHLRMVLDTSGNNVGTKRLGVVLDGAIMSAVNPYWYLWWATVGAACITLTRRIGNVAVAVFFIGHILSDYAWYGFVAILVATKRNKIPDWAYRTLVGICAFVLFGFGVLFIIGGIKGHE